MKGQGIKAKKQERKQQKAKEKRGQEAKKKFKVKAQNLNSFSLVHYHQDTSMCNFMRYAEQTTNS